MFAPRFHLGQRPPKLCTEVVCVWQGWLSQTQHYTIVVIGCGASLSMEGVQSASQHWIYMWTTHNISQHSSSPMDCARPHQFSSPTKVPRGKEMTWRQLKVLCTVLTPAHRKAFSWFFFSLDKPPPAGWVKESWGSHSSLWASSPDLWAQLPRTDVLILLGPCTVAQFDHDISAWQAVYQPRHRQPFGNPWP